VLAVSANAFAYVVFSTTGEQVFPTKTDKSSAGNMVEWYGEFNETRRLRFEYSWRTGAEVDAGGGSVSNPFNVPNDRGMPSSFNFGSCSIKFQKFETTMVQPVYETEYVDRYVAVWQAIVKDQKTSGLGGGTFTGFKHEWQTRDLNTVEDPLGLGVTVTNDIIELPAGAYSLNVRCPATWEAFRCSLYNTDTNTRVAFGTVGGTDGTTTPNSASIVDYLVNNSSTVHFRVDIQRSSNDTVTCGETCLGYPMGSHDDPEVYTVVTVVAQRSSEWNPLQGEQGPPGPTGPTGPTGPQGPVGPASTVELTQMSQAERNVYLFAEGLSVGDVIYNTDERQMQIFSGNDIFWTQVVTFSRKLDSFLETPSLLAYIGPGGTDRERNVFRVMGESYDNADFWCDCMVYQSTVATARRIRCMPGSTITLQIGVTSNNWLSASMATPDSTQVEFYIMRLRWVNPG